MSRYPLLDQHLPSVAPYLAWWLDGLRLGARAGRAPLARLRVTWDAADGLRGAQGGALPRGALALVVPDADWLNLSVTLPPVAPDEQRRILRHEIADRTPFDPADVEIGWSGGTRAHVVRKASLASARTAAGQQGRTLRWLVRAGAPDTDVIDMMPPRPRPFRAAVLLTALVAVLLLGLLGVVGRDLWRGAQQQRAATAAIQQLTPQATQARALSRQVKQLRADLRPAIPPALLPERAQIYVLLDQLSSAVPDSAYLTGLEFGPSGAVLRGWTDTPEALVRQLEAHEAFTNARLQGPVTAGPEGFRFDIRLEWDTSP